MRVCSMLGWEPTALRPSKNGDRVYGSKQTSGGRSLTSLDEERFRAVARNGSTSVGASSPASGSRAGSPSRWLSLPPVVREFGTALGCSAASPLRTRGVVVQLRMIPGDTLDRAIIAMHTDGRMTG